MWDAEFGKRVRAASLHETSSDGESHGLRPRNTEEQNSHSIHTSSARSGGQGQTKPQAGQQRSNNGPRRGATLPSSTSRGQHSPARNRHGSKAQEPSQKSKRSTRSPSAHTQRPAEARETRGRTKSSSAAVIHSSPISGSSRSNQASTSKGKGQARSQSTKSPEQRPQSLGGGDSVGVVTRSMARRMEAQERQKHAGDETLPKEKPPAPATATADVAASVSAPTRTSCTLASTSTQATSLAPKATTTRAENQSASPENHHHHVRRSPQFNYDRFIPARSPDSAIDMRAFERSHRPSSPAAARQVSHIEYKVQIEEANRTYDALLRSELLNDRSTIDDIDSSRRLRSSSPPPSRPSSRRDLYRLSSSPSQLPSLVPWSSSVAGGTSSRPTTPPTSPPRTAPMFQYRSPRKTSLVQPPGVSTPAPSHARNLFGRASPVHEVYQQSPIKQESRRILSPRQAPRRIAKDPVKVLDAPGIRDDYYLNLLDWSSTNKIAVALNSEVYMWDAKSSRANRVCDVGDQGGDDWVTSVRWAERGKHLAIGLNSGTVQIWDVNRGCKIRDFAGHSRRVGVLEWNGSILSSGSRDKRIYNRDTRMREGSVVSTFYAHEQEVCGLRWSPDRTQLASGGNDNLLNIWDTRFTPLNSLLRSAHPRIAPGARTFRRPLYQFTEHTAAVKALSWSPTQSGLLASGGGTDDRCIRMWNTQTGRQISSFDTGSQVCNLSWSHDGTEIASTHGYSQNHVIIWKYPSMRPAGILNGHTRRVLYLAHSPDGQTIVTAAGDETLRFWSVFPKSTRPGADAPSSSSGMQLMALAGGGSSVIVRGNKHLIRNYDAETHGYDDFTRLNRVLKKNGLYCKEMDGDGNCLFRALADQVDGTPDTHSRHREAVCSYMAHHPDEFVPFMDESSPFDLYVNNMRRLGVFAGNLELVAFARRYRVDIKVYQLGGKVFVISGAPANHPNDLHRNMPAVHIAYHSYEHYSSVRNKHGPHSGLPNIKPTADPDQGKPAAPPSAEVDDDSPAGDIERMVMGSTGVANLRLVRRLLRKHEQDSSQVIEILVQWMAEDLLGAEQWWLEDGPASYDGPTADTHVSNEQNSAVAEEAAKVDGDDDGNGNGQDPRRDNALGGAKPKYKHVKGMARQKKAESKKRQKEMAKMKKRKAAREAAVATNGTGAAGSSKAAAGSDGNDEVDITKSLDHIYI